MKNTFLRNKYNKNLVLMCDEHFVPLAEMPIGQVQPRDKAFYVEIPHGYIGVFSSINGPVLFIDRDKYLFSDPSWRVSVRKGPENNKVWFSNLIGADLHFKYKKVELDVLDPWSEEQFDDFFIWVSLKRNDCEFIDMWRDED